jgi:hypothetical protein
VALLKHELIKVFITHGGYHSLIEAAEAGIAMLSIALAPND